MTRDSKKNSHDAGGTSRAYVDTHYLLSFVFEETAAEETRRLLYKLRGDSYRILVSQTVLGEVTAKILQRYESGDIPERFQRYGSLFSDYGIDHVCLPGVDKDSGYHMSELQKIDDRLDPTDTLIISQVLADPDSKFFFTHDKDILDNKCIMEYEYQMREAKQRNTLLKDQRRAKLAAASPARRAHRQCIPALARL